MPEGNTTHRLAQRHQRYYGGSPVGVSSPQGRFSAAAAVLDGLVLQRAEAHGKHLSHIYRPDLIVHVHLGLYGAFTEAVLPVQPPRGQVRMRLIGSTHWTDLRGPTACELLTEPEVASVLTRLGPDPLRRDADPERAWAKISQSRAPLVTLLMDQSVLAGLSSVDREDPDGRRPRNRIPVRAQVVDVQRDCFSHQTDAFVIRVAGGHTTRQIRAPSSVSAVVTPLYDHRVSAQRRLHSMPACLRMLFSVPGGNVALGLPAIVVVPGLTAGRNCRWLPVTRSRYQPSASMILIISLTFSGTATTSIRPRQERGGR